MSFPLNTALIFAVTLSLIGCSLSPPKPPAVEGEYRPINRPTQVAALPQPKTFDYRFDGDIVDALEALQPFSTGLVVLPPEGPRSPISIKVNLYRATIEQALRAIGEQGGGAASVVWTPAPKGNGGKAFIRFHPENSARGFK